MSERRRVQPAVLTRQLRGDLDWIVMKALEKKRDDRYATAREFADDVERHLRNEPIEAKRPSLLDHVTKWSGSWPPAPIRGFATRRDPPRAARLAREGVVGVHRIV